MERAITSAAQVLIALMTVDGFSIVSADWSILLVAALTAMLLELLKGIVANASKDNTISPASLATERSNEDEKSERLAGNSGQSDEEVDYPDDPAPLGA